MTIAAPVRLLAFLVILVIVFVAAFGLGGAIGPEPTHEPATRMGGHER